YSSVSLRSLLFCFAPHSPSSTPQISTLSLHDALPIWNFNEEDVKIIHTSPLIPGSPIAVQKDLPQELKDKIRDFLLDYSEEYFRSEEHTSELQSRFDLVCRLLLEKKKSQQTDELAFIT